MIGEMTDPERLRPHRGAKLGFTLIEMMVAMAVMLILMVILLEVISGITTLWHNSSGSVSNFEAARSAFTTLNRVIARSTLKTYVDYVDDPTKNNVPFGNFRSSLATASTEYQNFTPANFARASELHFISGPSTVMFAGQSGVTAATNPWDAIFFQAPLGIVSTSANKYLQRSLNNLGF